MFAKIKMYYAIVGTEFMMSHERKTKYLEYFKLDLQKYFTYFNLLEI